MQIRNLVERIQMPTVRIGQPMTHLILSGASPPPKEKKPPIRSLRAKITQGSGLWRFEP